MISIDKILYLGYQSRPVIAIDKANEYIPVVAVLVKLLKLDERTGIIEKENNNRLLLAVVVIEIVLVKWVDYYYHKYDYIYDGRGGYLLRGYRVIEKLGRK